MNCKWIFKIKYNANEFVPKHKACLVIKRFTQVEGIDFNETFSPVTQMELIWIMLPTVAIEDLKVHQMDVKIAFLNEDLWKEIYMQLLEVLCSRVKRIWYINFKNPCMVWSNLLVNGNTRLMHILGIWKKLCWP